MLGHYVLVYAYYLHMVFGISFSGIHKYAELLSYEDHTNVTLL